MQELNDIRAVTIRQPWAGLIRARAKRFETRSWPPPSTLVGATIAVHAGRAALPRDLTTADIAVFEAGLGLPAEQWPTLPFGAVVCLATVVGAYRVGEWTHGSCSVSINAAVPGSPAIDKVVLRPDEWRFGDHRPGRWLWSLDDVRSLDPPVSAIGRQGIWRWPPPQPLQQL